MRRLSLFVMLLVTTSAWAGHPAPSQEERTRDDVDERTLTKAQIERYAAVYFPEIRACYAMHRGKTATGDYWFGSSFTATAPFTNSESSTHPAFFARTFAS